MINPHQKGGGAMARAVLTFLILISLAVWNYISLTQWSWLHYWVFCTFTLAVLSISLILDPVTIWVTIDKWHALAPSMSKALNHYRRIKGVQFWLKTGEVVIGMLCAKSDSRGTFGIRIDDATHEFAQSDVKRIVTTDEVAKREGIVWDFDEEKIEDKEIPNLWSWLKVLTKIIRKKIA